jgi:hypothetical protein
MYHGSRSMVAVEFDYTHKIEGGLHLCRVILQGNCISTKHYYIFNHDLLNNIPCLFQIHCISLLVVISENACVCFLEIEWNNNLITLCTMHGLTLLPLQGRIFLSLSLFTKLEFEMLYTSLDKKACSLSIDFTQIDHIKFHTLLSHWPKIINSTRNPQQRVAIHLVQL